GDALMYPETHYFIARKKLNDLRKYTRPTIEEVLKHFGLKIEDYKFNGQDNYYQLPNKSKVFLIDAPYLPSDPLYMRFGSMQMTRGMIEEAGEFDENAKNNLFASIGRWKNNEFGLSVKLVQTCNPSKNYLYRDYYKKSKDNTIEDWKVFIQALPTDNKMLDDGYLENLNRVLNKSQKERLLKGNWEYDDDPNALCEYDDILEVFKNDHVAGGSKYITADIARLGSDKAIIGVWEGLNLIEVHSFDVSRTTEIQAAIEALRAKHKIPTKHVVADEDGVGGGVVDNCKIKGFLNGSKALGDENYFNLQSQCCYKLAEKINEHAICISADLTGNEKDEIVEELEQLKSYDLDKDGKLRTLPKSKIKENIGRSPDWRDMIMMRMFFELGKKGRVRSSLIG
ncbi:MAG: terminase, partial [Flavobacteriales bacterium]